MKAIFDMGRQSGIARSMSFRIEDTVISDSWMRRLVFDGIEFALSSLDEFFWGRFVARDIDLLVDSYLSALRSARDYGLIRPGGIADKDHIALWCIGVSLDPTTYVESGVFIGSSLHAFMSAAPKAKIFGIDPDLSKLRRKLRARENLFLVGDKDFSELQFSFGTEDISLVYFDDHINAAARVVQASQMGFDYAVFDDATGLEGACQRRFPCLPSIPMVLRADRLAVGDHVSWSNFLPYPFPLRGLLAITKGRSLSGVERLSFEVTEDVLSECVAANQCVAAWCRVPDLGDFVPQRRPARTVDTTKYLLKLNRA